MNVLSACMCTTCMQCLWGPEEGVSFPWPGITGGVVSCHVGPLEEWPPTLNHCAISLTPTDAF